MTPAEIKNLVTLESMFRFYGSRPDATGKRWRCLFSANHHNGDCHHSMDTKNGRAKCWSQGCFGERGVDVFSLVGLMEGLTNFADQKRRVCEIGGLTENSVTQTRTIIRRYRWEDTQGNVAWHLRWDHGNKFTWSRDENGTKSGLGQCKPTLRNLEQVRLASTVILCAGERDQETVNHWLAELGLAPDSFATTTAFGESDIKETYLQALLDRSVVFLSGDNDEAGQGYVQKCGEILHEKVQDLRVLKVPEGWNDWTDWREQGGGTAEEFQALLDQAQSAPLLPHHKAPSLTLTSMKDFLNEEDDPVTWLVEDMLPQGGLSVIGGKPKAGKSTTARNLAIAVARGEPFLGFPTTQGPVIYCAFEEKRGEVKRHFEQLGATPDLPIFIFVGRTPDDMVQQIKKKAAEIKPALITLDTLIKVAKVKDLNDYAQVMKALDPFLWIARESGGHLQFVHHAGKSDRDGGDALLGSTAIFGTVDTCMIQKRTEKFRTLQTVQRYGTDLEETVLEWDAERKAISLGGSKKDSEVSRFRVEILVFLQTQEEPVGRELIEESIEGRTGLKRQALKALVDTKAVTRYGKGGKGDPFKYSCFVVPPIYWEQGNKQAKNGETPRQQRADSCSQESIDFEGTSKPREQENEAVLTEKNEVYEGVVDLC